MLIAAALVLVIGTALFVESLGFGLLRLAEGYWPRWLAFMGLPGRAFYQKRFVNLHKELTKLADSYSKHTPEQRARYQALDKASDLYPNTLPKVMPTKLGNILRSGESYSTDRYGLAAALMWPRLWLAMPDEARKEIGAAQMSLHGAVEASFYGLAFCIFGLLSIWAVPVGLLVAIVAHRRSLSGGVAFSNLLRSAFDLYHRKIFEAMNLEVSPPTSATMRQQGEALTQFIKRGTLAPAPPKNGLAKLFEDLLNRSGRP